MKGNTEHTEGTKGNPFLRDFCAGASPTGTAALDNYHDTYVSALFAAGGPTFLWLGRLGPGCRLAKRTGRREEAAARYVEAIGLRPEVAELRYNLGSIRLELVQNAAAAEAFGEALRLRPGWPQAHHNLGLALGEPVDRRGQELAGLFDLEAPDRPVAAVGVHGDALTPSSDRTSIIPCTSRSWTNEKPEELKHEARKP